MKSILILLLLNNWSSFAQKSYTFKNEVTFDKIILPGEKHLFDVCSETEKEAILVDGELIFEKAIIKDFGDCMYKQFIEDSTSYKCQIYSLDKKTAKKIIDYYNTLTIGKQSGSQTSDTGTNFNTVTINGIKYYVILHRSKKMKKAELIFLSA